VELISHAVAQVFLDCRTERRFLRVARGRLFPVYSPTRTPRRRTPDGVWARICQRVLALAAGVWHNWRHGQPGRGFTAYDH
jgi:hypothetical protein